MDNQPMSQKEFGKMIGKSPKTLQRWDSNNLFKARRNPAGEPFYLPEDVHRYFNLSTVENNSLEEM